MSRPRKALVAALLVAACLGVIVTRVLWDGRQALSEGDAALARGDVREAVTGWRRAARWYAPGAPHVAAAYDRLETLAQEAESHGDAATALEAWRGVRSSILSTRSFYVPFEHKLPVANEHIAALMAKTESADVAPGQDAAQRKAWHLALLSRDAAPSVGWTVLALLGFAGWLGGGVLFAWRGLGPEDRLDRRQALRSGLLVVVGLLVWMTGLYLA